MFVGSCVLGHDPLHGGGVMLTPASLSLMPAARLLPP